MYFRPASWPWTTAVSSGRIGTVAGKLDEHRQVEAGQHFDPARLHQGYRQIGRGTAKHVGDNDDALPGIDPCYRLHDVVAAAFEIVLSPNRNRGDGCLRSHHVFKGGEKLISKTPMRDEDKADHRLSMNVSPWG